MFRSLRSRLGLIVAALAIMAGATAVTTGAVTPTAAPPAVAPATADAHSGHTALVYRCRIPSYWAFKNVWSVAPGESSFITDSASNTIAWTNAPSSGTFSAYSQVPAYKAVDQLRPGQDLHGAGHRDPLPVT